MRTSATLAFRLFLIAIHLSIAVTVLPGIAGALEFPEMRIDTPVVHNGRYHILSSGETFVVLDAVRGMSIAAVGRGDIAKQGIAQEYRTFEHAVLGASLYGESETIRVSQEHDADARLMIIDQGPGRVAARTFFTLRSENGDHYGSGTLDIYLYSDRLFLVPSLFVDYREGWNTVSGAGFTFGLTGGLGELYSGGAKLNPDGGRRIIPFGGDDEPFMVTVSNPGRSAMTMGMLKVKYPAWMYMRHYQGNPETDELYERWPLWITQRGPAPSWNVAETSGFVASYGDRGLERIAFKWAAGDSLDVTGGGYRAFNSVFAVMFGDDGAKSKRIWKSHADPLNVTVDDGAFRYYNEYEGVYEIDASGGDTRAVFDNLQGEEPVSVHVRFWNIGRSGAHVIKADNKDIPYALFNDGDILEDPMVFIEKTATGPARFAGAEVVVNAGTRTVVTLESSPGIQFAYQMYSPLETYEAWSDRCTDSPLFRFHLGRGDMYHATLPGNDDYAIFKMPLYWLKNGVNPSTFMNRVRGFDIAENGPERLIFSFTGVDPAGTGRSKFTVAVPYERDRLAFDVTAEFEALDDGLRWSSLEYCNLYSFEHVYRRDFHYDHVTYLTEAGTYDRVGTGAWGGGFAVTELEGGGYYSVPEKREGPGTKTPGQRDGSVWLIGSNPARGNILYRRGEWLPSPGARSAFSLCNAWGDTHNTVIGRQRSSRNEKIAYTVEVFRGDVPSPDDLTAFYRKAAGGDAVKRVTGVTYSGDGVITGFDVAK